MKTESKTGRTRGVVYKAIRSLAMRRKKFKITDLCPPLTWGQANSGLNELIKHSEIVRVKRAVFMGSRARAIYQKTELLRPADLTNKQL